MDAGKRRGYLAGPPKNIEDEVVAQYWQNYLYAMHDLALTLHILRRPVKAQAIAQKLVVLKPESNVLEELEKLGSVHDDDLWEQVVEGIDYYLV